MSNENGTALTIRETGALELSVEQVLGQMEKIQKVMQLAMKKDEHYGVIPGTGQKPTLLKAGAEKLCLMFRFDPEYAISTVADGDHLTILSTCTLYHIPTGTRVGSGMGSCSTKESKYAYRKAQRVCPSCGSEAIIKGKAQYGGGWLCFAKRGGCGAKFADGDREIEDQETGRADNPDKADQYNTVLKMANKRSLVAAVLNATAASDIFTQDLEDLGDAREKLHREDGNDPSLTGDRQKPTDKATAEQIASFWAMLKRLYNGDEAKAKAWLKPQFARLGIKAWPQVTVAMLKDLTEKAAEFGRTEGPQDTPADDDDLLRSFEAEQAAKGPAPQRPMLTGQIISEAQMKRMYAIAGSDRDRVHDVIGRYGYEHSNAIDRADYEAICKDLEEARGNA